MIAAKASRASKRAIRRFVLAEDLDRSAMGVSGAVDITGYAL